MNDLDSQLIFETYYNARKRILNEGLLDAIKNKFKDFTADVIKPYAVKAMQFIAKKDPALAKQIAQAVKSKNLESLKNILKPGMDELSQGAKVNTEDLQTIRNFLNTGLGKGIAGAIMALAAFTVVTGGIGGEDINADGTIDTVTVDDGDPSTTTLAELEQIIKDAGLSLWSASDADVQAAVDAKAVKAGNEYNKTLADTQAELDDIFAQSTQDTLNTTKNYLDKLGQTVEDMDASEEERKEFSKEFDDLLKQAEELFNKTDATKKKN